MREIKRKGERTIGRGGKADKRKRDRRGDREVRWKKERSRRVRKGGR